MNPRTKHAKIHHKEVCLTQWTLSGTDLDSLGHMTLKLLEKHFNF